MVVMRDVQERIADSNGDKKDQGQLSILVELLDAFPAGHCLIERSWITSMIRIEGETPAHHNHACNERKNGKGHVGIVDAPSPMAGRVLLA